MKTTILFDTYPAWVYLNSQQVSLFFQSQINKRGQPLAFTIRHLKNRKFTIYLPPTRKYISKVYKHHTLNIPNIITYKTENQIIDWLQAKKVPLKSASDLTIKLKLKSFGILKAEQYINGVLHQYQLEIIKDEKHT